MIITPNSDKHLDPPKARSGYQDFFALWKDAEPDLPVPVAAKKEYEKLNCLEAM